MIRPKKSDPITAARISFIQELTVLTSVNIHSLHLNLFFNSVFAVSSYKSKKGGKDQESIQSSTTPIKVFSVKAQYIVIYFLQCYVYTL